MCYVERTFYDDLYEHIDFLKPLKGTRNIWVKAAADPFDKAKPITADTKRPIAPGQFFWSRDSRAVLYVQDQGGDENYNGVRRRSRRGARRRG